MNVDWYWIRQRPHILAQMLDARYDLTVLYPHYLTRPWRKQKMTQKTSKCHGIFYPPLLWKIPFLQWLVDCSLKRAAGDWNQYDVIWLSTPIYISLIPSDYRGKILYDDMDDIVSLQTDPVLAGCLAERQKLLFQRADAVIVTSNYLWARLPVDVRLKANLIRNATFQEQIFPLREACASQKKYILGYIGTISDWFDFNLIRRLLTSDPSFSLELFGPNIVKVPPIPGLRCHGVIEHERLPVAVRDVDCLLMPFCLNEITLAVDPVKLYEYIGLGKCIVSVRYPEVERFAPFVYFYETENEFITLIHHLAKNGFPPKYDANMQQEFLFANSWESRLDQIDTIIKNLLGDGGKYENNVCVRNQTRSDKDVSPGERVKSQTTVTDPCLCDRTASPNAGSGS